MQRYPKVFNNMFIGLIRAGEVGGVLEEALQRLSHFLEKDMELRRKVKAALTYPAIVVVVAVLIVLGLCTFIVPKFVELFKDLGVKELPMITQWLVNFQRLPQNEMVHRPRHRHSHLDGDKVRRNHQAWPPRY